MRGTRDAAFFGAIDRAIRLVIASTTAAEHPVLGFDDRVEIDSAPHQPDEANWSEASKADPTQHDAPLASRISPSITDC
ncbi:hypothetical protein GCM10029976_053300 [Kribbella albertanoniae]